MKDIRNYLNIVSENKENKSYEFINDLLFESHDYRGMFNSVYNFVIDNLDSFHERTAKNIKENIDDFIKRRITWAKKKHGEFSLEEIIETLYNLHWEGNNDPEELYKSIADCMIKFLYISAENVANKKLEQILNFPISVTFSDVDVNEKVEFFLKTDGEFSFDNTPITLCMTEKNLIKLLSANVNHLTYSAQTALKTTDLSNLLEIDISIPEYDAAHKFENINDVVNCVDSLKALQKY